MPNLQPEVIKVTVVSGSLVFSASTKRVYKDQQLQWECGYPAAFCFEGGRSPFKSGAVSGSAAANTPIGPYDIKNPSIYRSKNKYKYAFVVHVGGIPPILVEDPQIIIDDSSGGPKTGKKKTTKKKAAKKKTAKKKATKAKRKKATKK